MGCPAIWSNIILGVSAKAFLDEIYILIICGWGLPNLLKV